MDHRFRQYKLFIDTHRMEDVNDPVFPTRTLGFIGGGIFICACVVAYLVTVILLVAIGVNAKIAQSTGMAIGWFILLDRFSRHNPTSSTPKIATLSVVIGFLNYASLIVAQYLRSAKAASGGANRTRNSADLAAGSESVLREFLKSSAGK